MEVVHGESEWYRERPEPERRWNGVLVRREQARGPAARTASPYALATDRGLLAVYAAGVEERLEALVGSAVTVMAKLVDLTSEGFAPELWIGAVEPDRRPSRS